MAVYWAPDFSSFTLDPNARWMTSGDPWEASSQITGWHTMEAGDPWESGAGGGWKPIGGTQGNQYQQLKQAGAWNLQDPSLLKYFDRLAYTKFGGASNDWRTNPHAASMLLGKLGLSTYQPTNLFGGPSREQQIQQAFGFSPEYISQIEASRKLQQHESNKSNRGGLSGVIDAGGDFVEAAAPLALAAAGTYLGVNALGGLGAAGGAGGAGAGGTSAGLGSGITAGTTTGAAPGLGGALGSGLTATPAAGGLSAGLAAPSTTIGGGALGGGLSGAAASGSALAPGYFAAEGALGGGSGVAAGGASAGSTFAPSNEGIFGTGITAADAARAIPGLLGAIASDRQADAYRGLADRYMAVGAPSRARFEASYSPDFSMEDDPGFLDALRQAARANMHALSVGSGNPYGNPNALMQSQADLYQRFAYPALQEYRRMNAGAGGLAALTSAAPSAAGLGIQAQGNVFNSLGGAAADIFNPPKSLADVLKNVRVY